MLKKFLYIPRLLILDSLNFIFLVRYLFQYQKNNASQNQVFIIIMDWKLFVYSLFSVEFKKKIQESLFIIPKGFLFLFFIRNLLKMQFKLRFLNRFSKDIPFNFDMDEQSFIWAESFKKMSSNLDLKESFLKIITQISKKEKIKTIEANLDLSFIILRFLRKDIKSIFFLFDTSQKERNKIQKYIRFILPNVNILDSYTISSRSKKTDAKTQLQFFLENLKKIRPDFLFLALEKKKTLTKLLKEKIIYQSSSFLVSSTDILSIFSSKRHHLFFKIKNFIKSFISYSFFYIPIWGLLICLYQIKPSHKIFKYQEIRKN